MPKTETVNHDAKINEAFEKSVERDVLTSWPELEQSIRQVLRDYNDGRLSMLHTLRFIDGYLGAYTLRGCELNGGKKW